jgi:hypothetical protein
MVFCELEIMDVKNNGDLEASPRKRIHLWTVGDKQSTSHQPREPKPGTDVMIFFKFSPKISAKNWRF